MASGRDHDKESLPSPGQALKWIPQLDLYDPYLPPGDIQLPFRTLAQPTLQIVWHNNTPKPLTLPCSDRLTESPVSVILRWRLSLTVPNGYLGTLILYLYLKPFAELVEKVPGILNQLAELDIAVHETVVTRQCQSKFSR